MKGPFNQKENHQVQNFQSNNQEIDRNKLTPKDFDQRARETQELGAISAANTTEMATQKTMSMDSFKPKIGKPIRINWVH